MIPAATVPSPNPHDPARSNRRELAFAALALLFLFLAAADPFKFMSFVRTGNETEGGSYKPVVWAAIYALFMWPFVRSFASIAWLWSRNLWLLALYVLVLASVFWSSSIGGGLMAAAAPIGAAIATSTMAVRYTPAQMLRLCTLALMGCALASMAAVIVFPSYAVMGGSHEGLWRGITGQKNTLAQIMLAGVFVCALARLGATRTSRKVFGLGALLCLATLLAAGSATSLLVGGACVGVGLFVWLLRRAGGHGHSRALLALLGFLGIAAIFLLGAQLSETGLELMGRDATLTDRIPLWNGVLNAIADKPLFGWGYGQFWSASGDAIAYIRSFLLWDAPHAHNGWLELALNLGMVGVFVFAISLIVYIARLKTEILVKRSELAALAVLSLSLLLFLNFTESAILTGANILWVLYLYCALRLPLERHQRTGQKT